MSISILLNRAVKMVAFAVNSPCNYYKLFYNLNVTTNAAG